MKKTIALLWLTAFTASAQVQMIDLVTPHTNSYTTTAKITIPGVCTNATYTTTNYVVISNGDAPPTAYGKMNSDLNFITNRLAIVLVTNAMSLAYGSTPTVTNVGNTMVAVLQFGIPAGAPGTNTITNTVTAYAFSNQFLSSQQIVTYSTNNITWGTSNFLARVNGLYDWSANYGQLGGGGLAPGTNVYGQLNGSFSGTNGWFILTNGFTTTNMISVAATGAGGGLGNATLFAVDRPELLGRTNSFFGQYVRFDSPRDSADAATKAYVDVSVANVKDGNFSSYTDTNNTLHFIYSRNNFTVYDMSSTASYIHIEGLALDGTGTNMLLTAYQTNLANGFTLQSSTNMNLTAGFVTFTNWTTNTASGLTTFTIPLNFTEPQRFFRIQSSSSSSSTYYVPVSFNVGTIYPSNTWSLASVTNQIPNKAFWQGSSNGDALVTLWRSNATGFYVTWSNGVAIKTPAW